MSPESFCPWSLPRMVTWQPLLVLFLVIMNQLMDTRATVTLTSSVDGRRACPTEVVTYTCTGVGIGILEWTAEPFLEDDGAQSNTIIFFSTDMGRVGQTVNCVNRSIAMQDCAGFQATLISIFNIMMNDEADMISTLAVTARALLNETVVQCRGTTTSEILTATNSISVTSLPSPALFQTPSYSVQEYDRDNVTIRVFWQSPHDDGGAPVVNYTITVIPGLIQLTTTATSAMVTISYNIMHTVSIVVTNCNGSSSAVMETIPAIVDCGPPPALQNGSLESYTNTTEGSVVFYSCDPGLVPEMRMMSVCTGSGWSPNPADLNCSVVTCVMPVGPRNGFIEQYQMVGAEILFMCAPGYVPAGRMRASCTSDGITVDGTWTPDPATLVCNASSVDCGDPTNASSEVIVQYTSTRVNSVIFYQCRQSGFAPSSSSAVCMESGRWSPDPSQVVCRMTTTMPMPTVDCGPPSVPRNGSLESYSITTEGSVVFYSCDPGLVPEGRMRTVCTENGWSPNPADLNCFSRSFCGSCATSVAVTAVVSCAVSLIIAALVGAVVHYCVVRKKSKCHKFYSLTITHKQQKQQPAPVYEDIVAQKGTVDPTHIELRENIAYGPVQN